MLGYWLSFYANRLERTHFVILAELSPKKPTLISILGILDLMLFNLEHIHPGLRKRLRRLNVRVQGHYIFAIKEFFFLPSRQTLHFVGKIPNILSLCLFSNKIVGKKPYIFRRECVGE